jgi:hypothetical protein
MLNINPNFNAVDSSQRQIIIGIDQSQCFAIWRLSFAPQSSPNTRTTTKESQNPFFVAPWRVIVHKIKTIHCLRIIRIPRLDC